MLKEAPGDLPQLVVIDGGKGQLNYACQALAELGLTGRMTIISLAITKIGRASCRERV